MKLLFLTTFNISLEREHFFTIDVWKELAKYSCSNLATIEFYNSCDEIKIITEIRNGRNYYILNIPVSKKSDKDYIIDGVKMLFSKINPTVIHSNMIEGYDIEAAKKLGIPIFLTIHIGGFICPRGGGNGFLKYDDTICNVPIGKQCMKCGCKDLPLSKISYLLLKYTPKRFIKWLSYKLRNKNIFYITPLLNKYINILNRERFVELLKYAKIIAANKKLEELLIINRVPRENIELLPHGVKEREHLPMPEYNGKIKFYFLGRIQYSKGLHILMDSLEGIDPTKYELHIIGKCGTAFNERRYYNSVVKKSKGKSVFFHGHIPNNRIETIVKDFHVMIHPTICHEVYGISISESLSMGRPVLATRCGGTEMQIIDEENGWLVEPNNPQKLNDLIQKIIQNYKVVYKMASRTKLPMDIFSYVQKLLLVYNNYKK